MTVRDLMRKLIELRPDELVFIDAAGRGTYCIADIEGGRNYSATIITEHDLHERSSVHDADETIEHFTSQRG